MILSQPTNQLNAWAAHGMRWSLSRSLGKRIAARPFSQNCEHRLLIYFDENEISFSQVYPFLALSHAFMAKYGVEIRALPIDAFLSGSSPTTGSADTVLIQPWFTVDIDKLLRSLENLKNGDPSVKVSFLDAYAHNDLRLAPALDAYIRHYLKKSIFNDAGNYFTSFRGGTNLTQYYSDLCNIPAEEIDWGVPASFPQKLRLVPNFLVAPRLSSMFARMQPLHQDQRKIDLHSRLGSRGTPWYAAMRALAIERVASVKGVVHSPAGNASYTNFMKELQSSRLCFSPFGYGEVCWRDIEAFATGAVLIKPEMSHLDTLPNLYEPGVTYLPVRWDFADLQDVIHQALADPWKCEQVALEAFDRARRYLTSAKFVSDMSFLFD